MGYVRAIYMGFLLSAARPPIGYARRLAVAVLSYNVGIISQKGSFHVFVSFETIYSAKTPTPEPHLSSSPSHGSKVGASTPLEGAQDGFRRAIISSTENKDPYHRRRPEPGQIYVDGDDNEWRSYEIEQLIKRRINKQGGRPQLEYLARWKGFSPVHDQWYPREV
ncbi:hypothetical protein CHU98_g3944 [Xylaria longipes]|nr:hypothetical protein CHU98_g3944 [Xylaria longipes]